MSTADVFHLENRAKNIESSPEFDKFNMVRIIVGENEDGEQLIYEAGSIADGGRCLEVTNPYGTQQMANNMLEAIKGYRYKPYTADGALLDPAAELGDAVYIGDVYSVIATNETTFSPIMSATISAVNSSDIDHEYPYESKANTEIARKFNNITTSFRVELGRISTEISNTYETKADAQTTKGQLQLQITQTASGILQSVSQTYETKTAASSMEGRLNSSIEQTAINITQSVSQTYETKANASSKLTEAKNYADQQDDSVKRTLNTSINQTATNITSTVASAQSKYSIPDGVTINYFGYGQCSLSGSTYVNKIYLDQASGYYYKYNGASWVKQNSQALPLITSNLNSKIDQTASQITLQVNGQYADTFDEWEVNHAYAVGDKVKVTTKTNNVVTGIFFYECKAAHTSNNTRKPPNGTYWQSLSAPTVQNMIDINLDGIQLVAGESGSPNSATLELRKDGVRITGQTITMSNVTATSISADNITAGTMNAGEIAVDGKFTVKLTENNQTTNCGWLGGGYAKIPDYPNTYANAVALGSVSDVAYIAVSDSVVQDNVKSGSAMLRNRDAVVYCNASFYQNQSAAGSFTDVHPYCCMETSNGDHFIAVTYNKIRMSEQPDYGSDLRIKKDINYDMSKYEKVFRNLKPCSYRRKDSSDKKEHTGYIAQDVDVALREVGIFDSAIVGRDDDFRGNSDGDPMMSLRYGEFTAINTYMIQKLMERIDALEARVGS